MKTFIGLGVIASFAMLGCATDELETSEATSDLTVIGPGDGTGTHRHCPQEGCDTYNGAGIYTDENGYATIVQGGNAMIVRFYNQGDGMRAEVRFDNPNGTHTVTAYPATQAIIGGQPYTLTGMEENLTLPTFHFANHADVTGSNIVGVSIYIDMSSFAGEYRFQHGVTVTFTGWLNEPTLNATAPYDASEILHSYTVKINDSYGYNAATAWVYCHQENEDLDRVVFQQDIWVNAASSDVNRQPGTMTFSCRRGGIATVRWWGYAYRGSIANMYLFQTALNMKRAAYCGDGKFYTEDRTSIGFRDLVYTPPVNNMPVAAVDAEAQWSWDTVNDRFRATCVKPTHFRHEELTSGFWDSTNNVGHCADGTTIPVCPNTVKSDTWLMDKPDPTQNTLP